MVNAHENCQYNSAIAGVIKLAARFRWRVFRATLLDCGTATRDLSEGSAIRLP